MTPKDQAEILADKCTDAIIEAPESKHTQDIIRDTCCLVELLEVTRAAEQLEHQADKVYKYSSWIGMCEYLDCPDARVLLNEALAALHAKLPKEVE